MGVATTINVKALLFLLAIIILAIVIGCSSSDTANEYFSDADTESLKHLSNALSAWYNINQVDELKSDKDYEQILTLLDTVYLECQSISDSTLIKIDHEFKKQLRDNLQGGAHLLAGGMRAIYNKNGTVPVSQAKGDMQSGHQMMLLFHQYYNKNIEGIVGKLRSRGVDIFG
jgi:hypothetical protein